MKKKVITLFGILALSLAVHSQTSVVEARNTMPVSEGDSKETIIAKAAHVIPTANQLAALNNEFIAFIHFGPNTFTRMEWGNGKEDPAIFNLKELHTDQWCAAMKAAGMKMVIITVKHHDGFVLWQSRYTTHGIMSTGFREGKGDILKDLSASCKKYGLKLGIYLSPADLFQIESPTGLYGNLSKATNRTIPRPVAGRPFINKTTFQFLVDDYNEYFLNQLFELLTEYGPIHEVWFDGAHPKRKGNQQYNYAAWKKLIKTIAPKAVVFGKEDIRWCGNGAGRTRDTEWNIIPYPEDSHKMNNFPDLTRKTLGEREDLYNGKYLHYQQAETNTSIREGWFYRDDTYQKVRSVDDVFDIYERSVGGNSTFLLNIPPNRDGKFSTADSAVLFQVGERINETYGTNLFNKATGPVQVLDNNAVTFYPLTKGQREIVISASSPVTINRIVIQEAIATHSERVEKHAVDAWINEEWKEIASATNIGHKRILRFPETRAKKFRVRILQSRLDPAISSISAHYYRTRPPQLAFSRDRSGFLTIAPLLQDFNWNPHGENAAENLNTGYTIYYTLDNSEPGRSSLKYHGPFKVEGKEVKAVSMDNTSAGTVSSQVFGIIKEHWRLTKASSERERHSAMMAFDAKPTTYWQSEDSAAVHFLALDLGNKYSIKGFSYMPQKQHANGMLAKGVIKISADGVNWQDIETFEFGNLVNDRSTRNHYFEKPVNTRFIRIETAGVFANDMSLAIAELDFFL